MLKSSLSSGSESRLAGFAGAALASGEASKLSTRKSAARSAISTTEKFPQLLHRALAVTQHTEGIAKQPIAANLIESKLPAPPVISLSDAPFPIPVGESPASNKVLQGIANKTEAAKSPAKDSSALVGPPSANASETPPSLLFASPIQSQLPSSATVPTQSLQNVVAIISAPETKPSELLDPGKQSAKLSSQPIPLSSTTKNSPRSDSATVQSAAKAGEVKRGSEAVSAPLLPQQSGLTKIASSDLAQISASAHTNSEHRETASNARDAEQGSSGAESKRPNSFAAEGAHIKGASSPSLALALEDVAAAGGTSSSQNTVPSANATVPAAIPVTGVRQLWSSPPALRRSRRRARASATIKPASCPTTSSGLATRITSTSEPISGVSNST